MNIYRKNRREYYDTARDLARSRHGLQWLFACLRDPSPQMTCYKMKVIQCAIRNVHPTIKF